MAQVTGNQMTQWEGVRAFVTGHTGFKGGWLCLMLKSLGAEVSGYSLDPLTSPCLFEAANVAGQVEGTIADIRDGAALREALARAAPEVVFHLAAQPIVLTSYEDPVGTYETNVMGTVHLLEAVRHVPGIRAVVIVTSDKCYENREWHWGYRENDPLGGADPYASSKACTELVTQAYRQSFFSASGSAVQVASVRAGNVIGGGDWSPYRLVPDAMKAFSTGETLVVRSPHSVRPWQHVLDPLEGYLKVAERLMQGDAKVAESFNFGPAAQETMRVDDLVARLAEHWGGDAAWSVEPPEAPRHEAGLLMLDSTRARQVLKWRPRLDLNKGLEWTVAWYRAFSNGEDMADFTLKQVADYQGLDQAGAEVSQPETSPQPSSAAS